MTQSNIISEAPVFTPAVTERAFATVLPEVAAVPDAETVQISLDVVAAATTVLGVVPALKTLRAEIAELPRFNIERFDKLEQYALGLLHAHTLHRMAQMPKGQITQLGIELTAIRDRFYGNAMSLADNGLLDGTRLKDCKKAIGYRATASDVLTIVELLKESWLNIEGKTPITPPAMLDAQNRAAELLSAVGIRAQNAEVASEKAQLRSKAWTLFLRAYEDTRHAVEFVRREERDASEFAPSLFAGRGGRRREDEAERDAPTKTSADAASAAASKTSRTEPPPPIVIENPEGLPIDSPFTN